MSRVVEICEALKDVLVAADEISKFVDVLSVSRSYMSLADLASITDDQVHVVIVPSHSSRRRTSNGTFRRDVVVEIVIRKKLGDDADYELDESDDAVGVVEKIDDYLAHPDNADLTLSDGEIATYIDPSENGVSSEVKAGLGAYWHWEHMGTMRMVTGTVRVAYGVDEAYPATA